MPNHDRSMPRAPDAKEVIIEFLSRASGEGLPDQIGPEDTLDRIAICAELVDSGCLTGSVTLGNDGRPVNIGGPRITTFGREYLGRLIKERDEKKAWPVAKVSVQWILRWIVLPIVLAVIIAWLIKYFRLK